jgi:hypothetical protein
VDAARDEHDEHPAASRDCFLERVELPHAYLPADTDHLVAPT